MNEEDIEENVLALNRAKIRREHASEIKVMVNNSWKENPLSEDQAIDIILKRLGE